jgi:hypothetical protein
MTTLKSVDSLIIQSKTELYLEKSTQFLFFQSIHGCIVVGSLYKCGIYVVCIIRYSTCLTNVNSKLAYIKFYNAMRFHRQVMTKNALK